MVCAPSRQPFPQSSALPPMLPAVWSLHRMPAWPQLSTVGLLGRARNPSKLTVWCRYSGSGLSCRRAKCARLEQRSLALCRQQLPYRCEPSHSQCASICRRIRSAGRFPGWGAPWHRRACPPSGAVVGPVQTERPAGSRLSRPLLPGPGSRAWRVLRAPASKLAAWSLPWVPKSRRRPLPPWLFDHRPHSQCSAHRGSAASESHCAFLAMGGVRHTATATVDPS